MRYEPEHKARTHQRIVKNAARRLRAEGLKGPGLARVMKASGLTVGGFYKHFRSKNELLTEALEQGFAEFRDTIFEALKDVPRSERWKEIVRWYMSPEHCEDMGTGCPVPALAPEIARSGPAVRKRVADALKARRERLLEFMPGGTPEQRGRSFNVIFSAMAGAVAIARILENPEKRRFLDSVRDYLLESF